MNLIKAKDFLYAQKIIKILTTPWEKQDAFKYGIIDENGNLLKKYKDLKTLEEKDSYTYLHKLVFNIKRILDKDTGNNPFTTTASYLLLKENLNDLEISEEGWEMIKKTIFAMVQEETPTNVTGSQVSVDVQKPLNLKVQKRKDKKSIDN